LCIINAQLNAVVVAVTVTVAVNVIYFIYLGLLYDVSEYNIANVNRYIAAKKYGTGFVTHRLRL